MHEMASQSSVPKKLLQLFSDEGINDNNIVMRRNSSTSLEIKVVHDKIVVDEKILQDQYKLKIADLESYWGKKPYHQIRTKISTLREACGEIPSRALFRKGPANNNVYTKRRRCAFAARRRKARNGSAI